MKGILSFRVFGRPFLAAAVCLTAQAQPAVFSDPLQSLERTCFQTHSPWRGDCDLRSDVAIVYGFDSTMPERVKSWREHGYRVHLMTGVAWGNYQDYLKGRFDGHNHEDEEQTARDGRPHGHGGGAYYMSPSTNYGNYLCAGVRRALEAGVEAVHLEEPEFWVEDGYSEGFKREWQQFYGEPWVPPHASVDAQWRASNLKYYLYRRTLQQVFDSVLEYNRQNNKHVRCYVPTHSLINYASWSIVSPESSLSRLNGCDGYIAQVWTGTSRTPNTYLGRTKERTFETAFLEYGAMQNLVRSTGRSVWYLNDPIEDNPEHGWDDYQRNWECTLTASLFQPEVWQYEAAPWPERIFSRRYPRRAPPPGPQPMPAAYATELQAVWHALDDMRQTNVSWDCGSGGMGVLVSDSLMFERGEPAPSDKLLGHIYGMALPFLKRGMPVQPVQLEDAPIPGYLDAFHCLLLTYRGMKPLTPAVHWPLAEWVKRGGLLVVCDDDGDPFNSVREWWNTNDMHYATPRQHLFEQLRLEKDNPAPRRVGKGQVVWIHRDPAELAASADGGAILADAVRKAAQSMEAFPFPHFQWSETNCLLLRRGPYVIADGLDESIPGAPRALHGRFINLFDSELRVQRDITLAPNSRFVLFDIDAPEAAGRALLAAACGAVTVKEGADGATIMVEGVEHTQGLAVLRAPGAPSSVLLGGQAPENVRYDAAEKLLWVRFANEASPRELTVRF
ncbi:MAG TPA: hypothetical protein VGO59_07790 [Verrucomicrobiae bacterium]|jgi:hypothetical protein